MLFDWSTFSDWAGCECCEVTKGADTPVSSVLFAAAGTLAATAEFELHVLMFRCLLDCCWSAVSADVSDSFPPYDTQNKKGTWLI